MPINPGDIVTVKGTRRTYRKIKVDEQGPRERHGLTVYSGEVIETNDDTAPGKAWFYEQDVIEVL